MRKIFGILVCSLVLFFGLSAGAQTWTPDLEDGLDLNISGTVEMDVDIDFGTTTFSGVQIAFGYDEAELNILDVTLGPASNALQGGNGPDFFAASVVADCTSDGLRYRQMGMVADLTGAGDITGTGHWFTVLVAAAPTAVVGRTYDVNIKDTPEVCSNIVSGVNASIGSGATDLTTQYDPTAGDFVGDITIVDVEFIRGDVVDDGTVNIVDPIQSLSNLFTTGSFTCEDAGDSNDDGELNLADPIHTLQYLFAMGAAPPTPFGTTECQNDPTSDNLGCDIYDGC